MNQSQELRMAAAPNPGAVFQRFYHCWGPQVMQDAYGWSRPPAQARQGEHVFEFTTPPGQWALPELVGWGSLTQSPFGGEYFLSLGVFPTWTRRGLRRQMVHCLAEHAFSALGAVQVTRFILGRDPGRRALALRSIVGTPWREAGAFWYPEPAMVLVCTREDWSRAHAG